MKLVSKGKVINSSEFYKRKQRRKRMLLSLYIVLAIALIYSFFYLARHPRINISEVTVVGDEVIDRAVIRATAFEMLRGNYLWLIPKANAFFFPRGGIEATLLKNFPRFRSVELDLDSFQNLKITPEEHEPFALYCEAISNCYFLDADGLIFALAPSFSDGVYFIYTMNKKIENPLGKLFIPTEEFTLLPSFIESLSLLDVHPGKLEVGEDYYSLNLPNGSEIIFSRDTDLNLSYANLEAFLSDEAIKVQGDFWDRLVSLDLRTENKVFYRFR